MTEERPLVTFALFAYNQEAFIREAVEAALGQDYTPLEVIFSDDCSTDRTFEIINELVAAYDGPHKIIVHQTPENRGTLLHVAEVAALAQGSFLVLAAGDDVSKSQRTHVLVTAWRKTNAWALCSHFDKIDEKGAVLDVSVASGVLEGHRIQDYFHSEDGPVHIVHGCTSAYDKTVFEYLCLSPEDYILSEDGAMSVLLNLMGKRVVHLDESLVLYRESKGSLTNNRATMRLSYSEIANDEARIERLARSQANRCRLFLRMNERIGARRVRRMKVEEVEADLDFQEMRAGWSKLSLPGRIRFLLKGRRTAWAWPRLFGKQVFFAAKWTYRRLLARGLA